MKVYYSTDFSILMNNNKNYILEYLHNKFNYSGEPVIYGIHNKLIDKWYIGQTKDIYQRLWNSRNKEGHCQLIESNNHFIVNDGGIENFEFVILELCTNDELDDLEYYYVTKYDSYNSGYNKSIDGKGRWQKGLVYWINPITRDEVRLPVGVNPPSSDYINSNTTLGRTCYYNPCTKEMIKLLDNDIVPDGFIKGNSIKGKRVYRNINTGKVIRLSESDPVPNGYIIGNNTTNKLRVYSIMNRSRYTLSLEDIRNSDIPDLRLGCPRGKFWESDKWINRSIINKSEI